MRPGHTRPHVAATINTVLQNLPKYGQAMFGVRFLLHGRQFHTRLAPRASADSSTGVVTVRGTPGQLQQIDRGIQIPISHQTTLLAVIDSIRESEILIDPSTATTPFAGRLPPISQDHSGTIPAGLVEQLPLEFSEPHIADGLSQMVVLEHPADVQIFDDQHRLGFRQSGRDLMQRSCAVGS